MPCTNSKIGLLSRLAESQAAFIAFSYPEYKKEKKKFASISTFFRIHLEYYGCFGSCFKKDKLECVQRRITRMVSVLEDIPAIHHVLLINIGVMCANPIRQQRELTMVGIMPYGSSKYSWIKSQNAKNM